MFQTIKKSFVIHIPWYLKVLFFFQRKKCWAMENGVVIWYNSFRGKLYLVGVLNGHKS